MYIVRFRIICISFWMGWLVYIVRKLRIGIWSLRIYWFPVVGRLKSVILVVVRSLMRRVWIRLILFPGTIGHLSLFCVLLSIRWRLIFGLLAVYSLSCSCLSRCLRGRLRGISCLRFFRFWALSQLRRLISIRIRFLLIRLCFLRSKDTKERIWMKCSIWWEIEKNS